MEQRIDPPRHALPSVAVRGFAFSRRLVERVTNLCDAVHQALWLGLLDADGLQELTDHHYRATRTDGAKDVNYFRDAHNLRGFFQWEAEAVDAHFNDCKSVLIGSAGGGREVLAMAKRGVKVDAFECNPDLVDACRSFLKAQGVSAGLVIAQPSRVPDSLGTYDGAILGWGAYIHIAGRQQRIRFLEGLHGHIRPGGPLLLSFFMYTRSKARRVTFEMARAIRMIRGAAPIELGDSLSSTFDHRFTAEEIRQELAAAGFEVVALSEGRCDYAVAKALPSGDKVNWPR
jgi:hypothetical protein